MRRLLVLGAVVFLAAACNLPFGLGLASTSQLINGAADNLSKATGFELSGKFTTGTDKFTMDIQLQSGGSLHMDLTQNTTHIEFVQVGGKVYYKSQDLLNSLASGTFGQALAKYVGTKWFTNSSATPIDTSSFTDANKVKANFLNTLNMTRNDHVTVNGQDTAELSDSDSILNITESSPYQLVRLRTQSGKTVGGMTDGDLTFSNYGKDFAITAPTGVFQMDNPSTWPPYYEVLSVSNAGCNDPCALSAVLKNDGGPVTGSSPSTVVFTLTSKADNSSLGTCKASIAPDVANGASVTKGCSISSAAWTAFSGNYIYDATVTNPAYS